MSRLESKATHRGPVCCQRPMTTITVTSPVDVDAPTLALHACPACGRHVWEGDGEVLDRAEVIELVEHRVAEASATRAKPPR